MKRKRGGIGEGGEGEGRGEREWREILNVKSHEGGIREGSHRRRYKGNT